MERAQLSILLVEDDADDYLLTRELLADACSGGCRLEWARSYAAGRHALLGGEWDVCLLDYRLGAEDGLALLREAVARDCRTPIVMLTGQGDREVDLEAMRAGAADFLNKGEVSAALLERSIRYAIEHRRAIRARDEAHRIVAHDLRSPLHGIRMVLELVDGRVHPETADAKAREYLELARRAAGQMERLIEDMLDVARIEAGSLAVEWQRQSPSALVAEALAFHEALAAERSLEIRSELPSGLPDVRADRERILQVYGNLVGNAIKFTPSGGRILLRAEALEGEVRFSVADTGPGIQPEHLPHLFDRFWQAEKRGRQGAGLGLAIARGIVEAHGGRIWAESEPGVGTVFCFTLPATAPVAAGSPPP